MKKILVFGANGMLGKDLVKIDWFKIYPDYKTDITNWLQVFIKTLLVRPDYIINCAAYTDVDWAENDDNVWKCWSVNSCSKLVGICKLFNTPLVAFSTDYVFNWKKKEGYSEDEKLHNNRPLEIYWMSKWIMEFNILKNLKKYYIIRISSLFGKNGKNFVDLILNYEKEINVLWNNKMKPTYTVDLAENVKKLLQLEYPYWTYHFTNEWACSWYEFAKEINKYRTQPIKINKVDEFKRPAERPQYSELINNSPLKMRHWKESLKDYISNIKK